MFVVAGASGRVGSVVATELLHAEKPVTVLLRDAAQAPAWAARGARTLVGLLEDAAFVSAALKGATGLFAMQPPFSGSSFLAWQRAVADNVARAVEQSGVEHVALLSSVGAHLPAGSGPIIGCRYFEAVLGTAAVPTSVFRACYFQDDVRTALGVASQAGIFPTFAPAPDEPFPHVAARDVGHFIADALRSPPRTSQVLDVIGPLYSHRDVARHLGEVLGLELKIVEVPRPGWAPTLMKSGMSRELADLFVEMYDALARGLLVPVGERCLQGKTAIETTIRNFANGAAVRH